MKTNLSNKFPDSGFDHPSITQLSHSVLSSTSSTHLDDVKFRLPRERMVERLKNDDRIADERVLEAMREIPRHIFVPEVLTGKAYEDHALPIEAGQTISQPFIVARMTELLELEKDSRVLEIGAGSGYQTAILARVAGQVLSIERLPELARLAQERLRRLDIHNAVVTCFDGTLGWNAHAPYDAALVAAGAPAITESLVAQLKIGGRLVMPIGERRDAQRLIRIIRTEKGYEQEDHGACAFVPLIGRHGWAEQNRK